MPHNTHVHMTNSQPTLRTISKRSAKQGQSLVEYALILVLVAVTVIVVARLVGLATERVFGVTVAALGTTAEVAGNDGFIEITSATCYAVRSTGEVGLWVLGNSNIPPDQLTGSTEVTVNQVPVTANGSGFKYNPNIVSFPAEKTKALTSLCPNAVVIQSSGGAMAVAPVQKVQYD
jgi:Flp pilus assembly pilin Flp